MMDHLYSMDDGLKAGGPLLPLEKACENPVVGDEPLPETVSVVDPASVSRCCIEKGLFPAVPLFFSTLAALVKAGQNGLIVSCWTPLLAIFYTGRKFLKPSSYPSCGISISKQGCFVM
ncbi:uncharacterized protein Pyn_08784 [Prunus yedoensis var. nudiflora]|uniref:Uncharacterized protein n=1 Tax=Prunus yedoensis var. nudiflora TaxID=2094558 RepID=A0A315ASQ0_PRUYE|nr:uncharacterized protein Pyn_08784 [Prunus yedoensis var. nudiflora]